MTMEWHYTIHPDLGVLSLAGHLGPEAVARFTGAIGWVLPRGTGPVILDLTELRGWSVGGPITVAQAARQLAQEGRRRDRCRRLPSPGRHPSTDPRALRPALSSCCPPGDGRWQRQWCSDAWPKERTAAA
ncbi:MULTISPECIES: anti-sigma factor antagonist [unclassified Streptomyces]|uniref:anti-sigma factor antagonist n=1 Tax=unclassified Streptomyces TaxID=2593676 RepID=UPI002DDB87B0|nr:MULTISPECIES: anti-sigma factor antagonist [unclassified Streptomyces]